MCEQQYFFEYVLGWRGASNKKADKGTIVHKALETLAVIKKAQQDNQRYIEDEVLDKIDVEKYDLNQIIEKVYKYYSESFKHHEWLEKDYIDCKKWTYKAIELNNGMFDPRNRDIVCPEQRFDIEIKKPWAYYKYPDGTEGYLGLKGTIDLLTKVNDNTIEIIDWKTGRRLDWATGKEKTQESLQEDPQLRIYHYAVQQLYPEIENIIVTINFINDGGPFSVIYDRSDLTRTEAMLQRKFEVIKNSKKPVLSKTWKCSKFCPFGKTTFENTRITPIIEYRSGKTCAIDKNMTKCEQVKHDTDLRGMDSVIDEYTVPGYTIGKYKPPGSIE